MSPRRRKRSNQQSRGRGRLRRLLRSRLARNLAITFMLAFGGLVLALYVGVERRFEGRVWRLPTRVYSDVLELAAGQTLPATKLADRLDRSGYARITGRPQRPGQYSRDGRVIELHARGFRYPEGEHDEAWLRLRFAGERLVSITDERGRWLEHATLEPELLATFHGPRHEEREPVALSQIPAALIDAVLAAEDSRFRSHWGFDFRGIARALWTNTRAGQIVQGGSTITQQTVKNLFLEQERTWWRKAREALMAAMLEARYDKNRILEVYLNEVYFGQRGSVAICGVQAAARFYFGRDVQDLTLGESALLAGLIRSPGRYNPFVEPERARARRDGVLEAMQELGLATPDEVAAAQREELSLATGAGGFRSADHAVDHVRAELARLLPDHDPHRDGLVVYTTIETGWQVQATEALEAGLERLEHDATSVRRQSGQRSLEGVVLVLDPRTGAILAMVGGRDHDKSQFNRATQARRQPGSCFKPFVYAAGFERTARGEEGLTPASVLEDEPLVLQAGGAPWRPQNHDGSFRGAVTVRQALEESLNIPAVRAAQWVGVDEVIETAARCGLSSALPEVPSLALGTAEVTPLELATGYATFASQGVRHEPWVIRAVLDASGRTLLRGGDTGERVLRSETTALLNGILQGVLDHGTGRAARSLGYFGPAAGKTGTTDDTRDAWFVGYTPELLVLTWVGYDDGSRTGLSGSSGALPIWVDVMAHARPSSGFEEDPGVVRLWICPASGLAATRRCPDPIVESFVAGTEPAEACPLHRTVWRRLFSRVFH